MNALRKLLATSLKLALLAGLAAGGYYGYQQYFATGEEQGLGDLPTVVADVRDITVSVSATGVLQPLKVVEIKSKASGEILRMPVEMGDYVKAGDLIAQIDTRILDQEIKQATADYESSRIRLEIAGNQYERARSLHDQDLISSNDLETSQQNFTNAESAFIRAEASLQLARERLEDTTVTAPISGTIIAKTVEQGQIIASSTNNVSGGTILIQMADLTELEIRTLVDEIDIGVVKPGLRVESTVEAFASMRFQGEVMKIEPQAVVQQSVTTFPVLSRIDNDQGLLLPGMNADVNIIIHERHGVLSVANEAVRAPRDAREVMTLLNIEAIETGPRPAVVADTGSAAPEGNAAERSGLLLAADPQTRGEIATTNGDNGSHEGAGTNGTNGGAMLRPARLAGGTAGADAPGASRGGMARGDGNRQPQADADPWGTSGRREPAVVFVLEADGSITAREILTGVRDWEMTEVLSGLEGGEQLVLLPSTSLLRSQQSMRERFSQRSSLIPAAGR
jgi:HlyD family secretion protein